MDVQLFSLILKIKLITEKGTKSLLVEFLVLVQQF